jgi:hypothetical protein
VNAPLALVVVCALPGPRSVTLMPALFDCPA